MPTKQKSGMYRARILIGVDADGKDIYKYISGRTKKELEQHRQQAVAYYIDGTALAKDQLFGEYAVSWFETRKRPFISASAVNGYRSALNKHVLPRFGNRKLRAVMPMELQEFINGFAGSSKSQINMMLGILRGIFDAAEQDRLIEHNPAQHLIRPAATPPKEKEALTDDERGRMEAIFDTHPHGLYLATLYYTGMRPGEVRGLMWGDIDWSANLIHVQRDVDYATSKATLGELKTAASERYVPLTAQLRALLYPHRELPNTFLFPARDGGPLPQVTARRWWIDLMCACDMADPITEPTCYRPDDLRARYKPRITPHALRHNFITMCWEAGMDITLTMRIVGHTDYATTRNIYTHLSRKHLGNAQSQLNDMFAKSETAAKNYVALTLHKPR